MSREVNLFEKTLKSVPQGTDESCTRKEEIKRIIEALLFSTSDPLPLQKLKEIIQTSYPIRTQEVLEIIDLLKKEYHQQKRGVQIDEIAQGYLLRTVEAVNPFVELLHQNRRGEKLSRASMEVLAIVAHKQPITRLEIDQIRGVDSSGVLHSLGERGLIEPVGRLETPGRPNQYGITKRFLQHFGLNDIQELAHLSSRN